MLLEKILNVVKESNDLEYKLEDQLFYFSDGVQSPAPDQLYIKSKNPTIPLRLRVIKVDPNNPIDVIYCSKNYVTSLTVSDKIVGYWREDLSNNYLGRPLLTVEVDQIKEVDLIHATEIVITI